MSSERITAEQFDTYAQDGGVLSSALGSEFGEMLCRLSGRATGQIRDADNVR